MNLTDNSVNDMITANSKFGGKKAILKYWLYRVGFYLGFRYGTNEILPKKAFRIVFVCKGNICRSPYAEAYAHRLLLNESVSFGIDTTSGLSANDKILNLAYTNSIDLSSHKTTAISDFEFKTGDVYVCMEPSQSIFMRSIAPNADITLLGLYGPSKEPYIHDPYSSTLEYSSYCLQVIERKVKFLIEHLRQVESKS